MGVAGEVSDSFFKNLFEAIGGVFKKGINAMQVLHDSITIHDIAENVVKGGNNCVDCCFLMMVHNGGKRLIPHGFKYRSIVGGDHDEMLMPNFVPEDYKYLELDYEYELLVGRMYREKEVLVDVASMGDSKLSVKLRFEGIRQAKYFFLKQSRDAIWFIICGTIQSGQDFSNVTDKHEIDIAINKIKKIIKKYR